MRLSLPGRSPLPPAAPTGAGPDAAAAAFDLLYTHAAGEITRQLYLLTGDLAAAGRCAARAFQLAWQRWAEVAEDPDPEGWVRAAACEYALSPWRRLLPGQRAALRRRLGGGTTAGQPLIDALQALPPARRHAVLLYDAMGLGLPETAAETQASTPATAGRLDRAHAALAASVPELVGADPHHPEFSRRLGELMREVARAQDVRPIPPERVRHDGERYAGRLTLGTAGLVAVLVAGMVFTGFLGALRPDVLGTTGHTTPARHPANGPQTAPSPPPVPAAAPPPSPVPPVEPPAPPPSTPPAGAPATPAPAPPPPPAPLPAPPADPRTYPPTYPPPHPPTYGPPPRPQAPRPQPPRPQPAAPVTHPVPVPVTHPAVPPAVHTPRPRPPAAHVQAPRPATPPTPQAPDIEIPVLGRLSDLSIEGLDLSSLLN
jgi:DNA-directed RNA polymerase specialized sigma24 family protein